MRKILVALLCVCFSTSNFAGYNANMRGELKTLNVYVGGDYIYLQLKNQPTTHPTCKPDYFVIASTVPFERRQMLLSRAMMAFTSKENLNIGYDAQGDCANGYIRVHRIG